MMLSGTDRAPGEICDANFLTQTLISRANVTIFSVNRDRSEVAIMLLDELEALGVTATRLATHPSHLFGQEPWGIFQSDFSIQKVSAMKAVIAQAFQLTPIVIFDGIDSHEFDIPRLIALLRIDRRLGILVVAHDMVPAEEFSFGGPDGWLSWPLQKTEFQSKLGRLVDQRHARDSSLIDTADATRLVSEFPIEKSRSATSSKKNSLPCDAPCSSSVQYGAASTAAEAAGFWRLDLQGWRLISPDGRTIRLGYCELRMFVLMFSAKNYRLTYDTWSSELYCNTVGKLRGVIARVRQKSDAIGLRIPIRAERKNAYVFCEPVMTTVGAHKCIDALSVEGAGSLGEHRNNKQDDF